MQRPKFSKQTRVMDFSSKVRHIINLSHCTKHKKRPGQPCWWVPQGNGIGLYAAICNDRIKKVYDGKISDASTNRRNGSLSSASNNANRYSKKETA